MYAPWCGHCKALAPVWDDLWDAHQNQINVASVDCTADDGADICRQFSIRGFPSLLLLKNDKWYKYYGKRDLENLSKFFTEESYLKQVELTGQIPKRLEGWEQSKKDMEDFLKQLARTIDQMFDKTGLDIVPHFIRYGGISLMVLSPLLGVIYMLIFDDDGEEILA